MAFVNTIAKVLIGWGTPTFGGPPSTAAAGGGNVATAQATAVVVNATTTTVTFNALGTGNAVARQGWVRLKSTSVNGATTITCKITGTDGTTTQQLAPVPAATAAGTNIDWVFPFMSDLNLTSIAVAITSGVNTATYDVEVAINP